MGDAADIIFNEDLENYRDFFNDEDSEEEFIAFADQSPPKVCDHHLLLLLLFIDRPKPYLVLQILQINKTVRHYIYTLYSLSGLLKGA